MNINNKIRIGSRLIKNFSKPYIIAEACINHNGDLATAKKMILSAKQAGADCIKFQIHNLNNEMLKSAPISSNFKKNLWDTLNETNFNITQQKILKNFCTKIKIDYLCTPFSKIGADELDGIGVKLFKIGSGEMTNHPLIDYIAKKGKPIIFSTGMSQVSEIDETVEILKFYKTPFAIMHCTSIYPCPSNRVNLRMIPKYISRYKNIPVGLSDHTDNIFSSFGAVAHGACIIEKHFTLNKKQDGPDHKSSIEPAELKILVHGCNQIFRSNGDEKKIFQEERQILAWARESVVTEKNILKGEVFNKKNIWVKRPAPKKINIPAKYFIKILGKKAKKNIKINSQLKWSDVN